MKSTVARKECFYEECKLPKSNNKYGFQFVCFAISTMCFAKNPQQFTMISLLLYLFPIIIDLWTVELRPKALDYFRHGCVLVNSAICLIFVGGVLTGVMVDEGTAFKVLTTSMVLPGYTINKEVLWWITVWDLVIPVMFYVGLPNQKMMEAACKAQNP